MHSVKKLEPTAYVNLKGDWIKLSDVNVIRESEDIFGEDVVEYSYEGEVYTAKPIFRIDETEIRNK